MRRFLLLFALALAFVQAQVNVTLNAESAVEYEAHDQNDTWTGRAPVSRLEFSLNLEKLSDSSLTVAMKPGDFSSGNIFRDTNARRTVFETNDYPEIVFVSKGVRAVGDTLADGESREVRLRGDLTMHGVTKELETLVTLTRSGNTITATGGFEIKLTDYEMKPPTLFSIIVDENVIVRFIVVGEVQ